jgi:hypothetical protein
MRAMKSSPPQRSPVRAPTPLGRAAFHALAHELRQVFWPYKFNLGPIDKYDGSSNPEEFIKLYRTVIEVVGGDDQVKVNYLPTALSDAARSRLINLLEGTIYKWDQLYIVFIDSFQGTYKHPSTAETLKTIKQKHNESLRDYVNHFCNARNTIPNIQGIEIINAFRDGVSDIKTVEEITMKEPKMVADLLAVVDIYIEASKARVWLLDSRNKRPPKKK